jgi:hypothetical protein
MPLNFVPFVPDTFFPSFSRPFSRPFTSAVMCSVMNRYNQATIDVCREENVDCIDLAGMLPKDTTIFYDHCHFNISGCERVAEILADYSAERLEGDKM